MSNPGLNFPLTAEVEGFKQGLDEAARAVESSTARMNRAARDVAQVGTALQTVERGSRNLSLAANNVRSAMDLLGSAGSDTARQLAPAVGAVQSVTAAIGTLRTVVTGGAAALGGFSAVVPVLGAIAAAGATLYGVYQTLFRRTEEVKESHDAFAEAMRISEPLINRSSEAAARLAEEKRKQAREQLEAAAAAITEAKAQQEALIAGIRSEVARQRMELGDQDFSFQTFRDGAEQSIGVIAAEVAKLDGQLGAIAQRMEDIGSAGSAAGRAIGSALDDALRRLREGPEGQAYAEQERQLRELGEAARRMYAETRTEAERYEETLARISELYQRGLIDGDTAGRALTAAWERANRAATDMGRTGQSMLAGITSKLEEVIFTTRKWSDALNAAANDLARLIFRAGVTGPLEAAINPLISGLGNSISSAFGSLFGGSMGISSSQAAAIVAGGPTIQFRAAGGPVMAGMPYIVGEEGPEWFVPRAAGTILPNGVAPSSGGGVVLQQTFNIDLRGSSLTPAEVEARMRLAVQQAQVQTIDLIRRDPRIAAAVRGR